MKNLMKPIALLFLAAASTGAYAQQDGPAKPLKAKLKAEKPALTVQKKRLTKAYLVPNRDADIKRIVRRQGLSTAHVK